MKMNQSVISGVVGFAMAFAASGAFAAGETASGIKIGTVDMNKALQTVEAGKKAKSQLEKEIETRKKALQTEEAALKKLKEELEKQSLAMSDEARAKKGGEFQQRAMKFQESGVKIQQELMAKEQELTKPIVQKMRAIIAELSKAKGYNVVLEKNENTVLFSEEKDDLTQEVITKFNQGNKG